MSYTYPHGPAWPVMLRGTVADAMVPMGPGGVFLRTPALRALGAWCSAAHDAADAAGARLIDRAMAGDEGAAAEAEARFPGFSAEWAELAPRVSDAARRGIARAGASYAVAAALAALARAPTASTC